MKDTQLKELLAGKDLTKDEAIQEINTAINNEFNSILKKKEDSFNEKFDALQKENTSLKANTDLSSKQLKELNEKLIASDKTTDFLTKKNYIYKNISSELDDQDISDLLVLTNSRMGKDSKFEDVVKEVAEKRGFSKIKSAPSIAPSPAAKTSVSAPVEEVSKKTEKKIDKNAWAEWFGKKK